MALSASVLSAAIKANLLANEDSQVVDNDALQAMCDEIGAAVVAHVTGAGVVMPTALVAPAGGGPVTGTGTIL
jgi:hypothetical protein